MNIDSTMKELAEYIRLGEEVAANIEALKDVLKSHMEKCGIDTIAGTEHKVTYKAVISSRIDTAALKKERPDIATAYIRATETKRFTFA